MDYRKCANTAPHERHGWQSEYPRQTPESPPLTRTWECGGVAARCEKCQHAPHDGRRCLNMASDNDCACDLTADAEIDGPKRLVHEVKMMGHSVASHGPAALTTTHDPMYTWKLLRRLSDTLVHLEAAYQAVVSEYADARRDRQAQMTRIRGALDDAYRDQHRRPPARRSRQQEPVMSTTEDIALEVIAERARQTDKGWTPEHDAEHGPMHLLEHAMRRMPEAEWIAGEYALSMPMSAEGRKRLIEAAALIVAAIEVMDHENRITR